MHLYNVTPRDCVSAWLSLASAVYTYPVRDRVRPAAGNCEEGGGPRQPIARICTVPCWGRSVGQKARITVHRAVQARGCNCHGVTASRESRWDAVARQGPPGAVTLLRV